MIPNSREKAFQAAAKQEGQHDNNNVSSSSVTTTTSRQWTGFRNPRIVRVSRTFGGKDRHSKVSTVRGLRDRRIRLSVPTAIQLYDLQNRLGLSQPSKVVDWLLEVTEHDIDKLPPLQVPHGLFGHHHQILNPHHPFGHHHQILNPHHPPSNNNNPLGGFAPLFDQNHDQLRMSNSNEGGDQKGKSIIKTNDDDEQEDRRGRHNFHQHHHPSSIPGLLNNGMAYNYFHNFSEPSSLSLSQFGSHGFTQAPQMDHNALPFSASMPPLLGTGSHQLFFCPSTATPSSLFGPYPPYLSNPLVESSGAHEARQASHFQFLSSSSSSQNLVPNNSLIMPSLDSISSSLRSFGANNPNKQLSSQNINGGSQPNKDQH